MSDDNPYAPPTYSLTRPQPRLADQPFWTDGRYLLMHEGAELPNRCVKCNSLNVQQFLSRRLAWNPKWILLLVVLGYLPFLIALMLTQRRATIAIGLCADHVARRRRLIAVCWLLAISCLLAVVVAVNKTWGAVVVGPAATGMVAAMTFGALGARVVRAKAIEPPIVTVRGVCQEFLDQLPLEVR